ncbi:MAG: signal peptidase II [Planctomycetota bacterium]
MTDASAQPEKPRPESPPAFRAAWRSPGAWAVLLGTTVLGLVVDLWTKYAAFEHVAGDPVRVVRSEVMQTERLGTLLPPHAPIEVIPSVLNFTLVLNPGAVFGIGAGKRWIFVIFTLLAIGFAGWMFARWTAARDRWSHLALGLLVSGGLGNLYDRVVYACVRDFIHPLPGVKLPFGVTWPNGSDEVWPYVSNVADAFLIAAIVLLLAISFRKPPAMDEANGVSAATGKSAAGKTSTGN